MIHQRKKGFTLIELIIAITILAILAVGLIAALDPVEQINKSRDSVRRDQAIQIAEALERYYAINENYFPGVTTINGQDLQGTVVGDDDSNGEAYHMVDALTDLGELKTNFLTVNEANMDKTWIYRKDVTVSGVEIETPVVCVEVDSKSFSSQANLWNIPDGPDTGSDPDENLHTLIPTEGGTCADVGTTARPYCAFCVALQD